MINSSLAKILTHYPKDLEEYTSTLEDVLAEICKDTETTNRQEYYKRYLKILYKRGKLDALLTESARMHEQFSDDTYPLGERSMKILCCRIRFTHYYCHFSEWICRLYSEKSISNGSCDGIEITPFYETLSALNTESSMAAMAKGVNLYQKSNYIEARDIFNQVTLLKPTWLHPLIAVAEVNLRLYCFDEAERFAARAEQLIKSDTQRKLQQKLKLALLESRARSKNEKQLEICVNQCQEVSLYLSLTAVKSKNLIFILFSDDERRSVAKDQAAARASLYYPEGSESG